MIRHIKYSAVLIAAIVIVGSCKKEKYSLGTPQAPTDVVINTTIAGAGTGTPNGDGSGDVTITVTAKGALAVKIDYDASDGIALENLNGTVTKKYTKVGLNSYKITVVAYGTGAAPTTVTKDIQVQSNYTPPAAVVTNLFGTTGTKTWGVDKSVAGHFGVGPWSASSVTPEWWSASVNEKVGCCNCFYTAKFTFVKNANNTYTISVATPDGAFTKTGALAGGLPGIPGTGDEGCYTYGGGNSSFAFVPSSSGIAASTPSTKAAIMLSGNNTFIGYGALGKEYEILSITATTMYLRAQGTETGNAWYLKLVAQ